ncbi:hypothetical protein L9F63_017575, partial [Diploptera punctata]
IYSRGNRCRFSNLLSSPSRSYNPIKFNLANKKTGLGFKPFNNNNNNAGGGGGGGGGGNKKKRKKNKNNQFNNSFNNSMGVNSAMFMHHPPLPPTEAPPPFPPLPPLPQEPAPAPPSEDPPEDEPMDTTQIVKPAEPNTETPFSVTTKTLEERASAAVSNSQTQQKTSTPNSAPFNPSGDWPESLKNYVNRCYAKCVENVDKDQVEIILKGKITRAANEGSLWIKNWDTEPLPSIHSERKFIEIKKTYSSSSPDLSCSSTPAQKQQTGGRGKKSGLSAAMGSRLGARGYRRRSRSRTRSRSRSHSRSPSLNRSRRNRSRSSDSSRSPIRRRRTRSDSSSSSDENFKPLKLTKNRGKARQNNKGSKSHFYSEFGNIGEELGNSERLQQRAARFSSSNLKSTANSSPLVTPQRRKKPLSLVTTINNISVQEDVSGDIDWSEFHVVGTCQDLEKPYLRLTSAPDASIVRPLEVLKNSVKKVKERWIETHDYHYVCDQMKSIRQDLTVQGIRDDFTVEIYETHARIALEKGDHEEFNQCQTQLKMLYSEIGGANKLEFTAYRILYYIFTKNTLDLTTILASLTPEDKNDDCVRHALAVRSAWWLGNYHRLFRLYREAPRMAGYLVDWFVDRERKKFSDVFLLNILKVYRPLLPVSFVVQELAFESDEKCLEFLSPFDLTFADIQRTKIDCKSSVAVLNNI